MTTTEANRNLSRIGFKGGAAVPVTHYTDGRIMGYALSPDGRKLAMVRKLGIDQNVRVAAADGSRPVQVTHFTAQEVRQFLWLPDSRRLMIAVGTGSNDAVLVHNFR